MIRILLDEEDFKKLISGGIVEKTGKAPANTVQIALMDIGYDRIVKAVADKIKERK